MIPALATKLGVDMYGMKHYVMAFLKGATRIKDSAEQQRLQIAHLKKSCASR